MSNFKSISSIARGGLLFSFSGSPTLTLAGFNSSSMYFFAFSCNLLGEYITCLSSGSKEGSNGSEIKVLSEKKKEMPIQKLAFTFFIFPACP